MTDVEIGYMAGLLDGEGSVSIKKYTSPRGHNWYYAIEIQIYNNHRPVLEWIQLRFPGEVFSRKARANKNQKPSFVWRAWGQNAAGILRFLKPHLVIKSQHADAALSLYDIPRTPKAIRGKVGRPRTPPEVSEQRERLFRALRALNRRGLVA